MINKGKTASVLSDIDRVLNPIPDIFSVHPYSKITKTPLLAECGQCSKLDFKEDMRSVIMPDYSTQKVCFDCLSTILTGKPHPSSSKGYVNCSSCSALIKRGSIVPSIDDVVCPGQLCNDCYPHCWANLMDGMPYFMVIEDIIEEIERDYGSREC